MTRILLAVFTTVVLFLVSQQVLADVPSIPVLTAKQIGGTTSYSVSVKILALMALLTVLPALLITTTAFTRIIIVMAILRQALGIPSVPSNQIIIGLSLIMTLFVMTPIIQKTNDVALQPYLSGKLNEEQAFNITMTQLKGFMMKQTRKTDLRVFTNYPAPKSRIIMIIQCWS